MTNLEVILSFSVVVALVIVWLAARAMCTLHELERKAEERDE